MNWRGLFLESPETFRAFLRCYNLLCILRTERFYVINFHNHFSFSYLEKTLKDRLFKTSGFSNGFSGPESSRDFRETGPSWTRKPGSHLCDKHKDEFWDVHTVKQFGIRKRSNVGEDLVSFKVAYESSWLCLCLTHASSHLWNKHKREISTSTRREKFPFLVLILRLLPHDFSYAYAWTCRAYRTSGNQALFSWKPKKVLF